ncbi:hypothetical protein L7F22_026748 [Adiantum nelumboides]|nr:hypothetical protein [Adiantum nelumboides]
MLRCIEDDLLAFYNNTRHFTTSIAKLRKTQLESISWWEKYMNGVPTLLKPYVAPLLEDVTHEQQSEVLDEAEVIELKQYNDTLKSNYKMLGGESTWVEVVFENGQTFHLSAEFLRVQSPAADSKRRTISGEKVIAGRRNVGIMSMERVGNYGIRICFDDLHNTGIYSWDYLYNLGASKFSLMREYLNTLKKHNLSRSPRQKS